MSRIDIAQYLTAPNVNVPGAVALGVAVITAMPEGSPAPVVRAGKALRETTVVLQQAWQEEHTTDDPGADRPAADHRVDVAWNALYYRLEAYAGLPAHTYPNAGKAAAIQGSVFDDGLRFLTLPYAREWAESDRRLKLVEDKQTEPELRALVGDDFVDEVKKAHKEYGAALGITEAEQVPDEVGVHQPLRDVQAALRDYALQVVAAGNDDASFTDAARAALAPIDELRAAQARNASPPPRTATAPASPAAKAVPTPDSPLPPVTPTSPVPQVPGA